MNGWTTFCGRCGVPMRDCACVRTDDTRAALLADIAGALSLVSVPPPVLLEPSRFVKFGDSMICTVCQLDARYCKGHAPDGQPAESDLARHIRDAREAHGGR